MVTMVGMGTRGPAPKRAEQRRRRNKPAVATTEGGGVPTGPPDPDPRWHPMARDWYLALAQSGQSQWYQASDWATAVIAAEHLSRELSPKSIVTPNGHIKVKMAMTGASLAAVTRIMSLLLVTEADRRRLAIELSAPTEPAENVSWIDTARSRRSS